MAPDTHKRPSPKFWISAVSVIIVLIFLYFYQPIETYLSASLPNIHFSNVIFWFASMVGVICYVFAHWQSFRKNLLGSGGLDGQNLVFETLQIAIMTAVIFCAGATLQAIEMLGEHLMNNGPIIGEVFGEKLLAIVLLVLLAIVFYLLHHVVRAFRVGWQPRRPHPGMPRRTAP